MKPLLFRTIFLSISVMLASCGVPTTSTPEAPTPTNTQAPTATPTPAPILPSITELIINGAELYPQDTVYEIPGEINPGDTLNLTIIIQDNEVGAVEVLGNTKTYIPSPDYQTDMRLSLVVPPDLASNEFPLRLV